MDGMNASNREGGGGGGSENLPAALEKYNAANERPAAQTKIEGEK